MDCKNLFDFFRKVETEYPVQQWTVAGIHVWPLVRVQIGESFFTRTEKDVLCSQGVTGRKLGRWGLYGKYIQKILTDELNLCCLDFKHQQKLEQCDVVMMGDANDRNVQMPTGELMDHILDPLHDALQMEGYRVFKFEEINLDGPRYPRWTQSYPTNGMMLMARIKRKWNGGNVKDTRIDMEAYHSIMEEFSLLQSYFIPVSLEHIISSAFYIYFLAAEFLSRLRLIKPRLVLLECWYSTNKMALCLAAHRLGIPVVDVQHGVAGESGLHIAYCDWNNLPSNGYETMPNYMWAWSQGDYEVITRWGQEQVIPILGGKPMDLIWSNSQSVVVQYYCDLYEKNFATDFPTILFSLQWGLDYPDWIIDFINQSNDYFWLIRLHPKVDDSERVFMRKLKQKRNIIWKSVSSFPLEILLQKVSLHITMYSSVVIDGEREGLSSIVLHPLALQLYELQIKRGRVCYADNPVELSMAIHNFLLSRRVRDDNEKRQEALYDQGYAGVQRLIEIMEK